MKPIRKILLLLTMFSSFGFAAYSQTKEQKKAKAIADTKALVDSKKFRFIAQFAQPMGGRNIQLTSEYDVQIKNDTMIVFLPYYGRDYVAPMDPSQGGIKFTSTDFTYTKSARKKGGWQISIVPKNQDVRQMYLTVSDEGYSSLQVTSNNRQAISFNGIVDKLRESKKKK
ncbi:DUF4251 domain-containing protein [Pedobacter sp. HMF7647]|uniref:DUF4251 domain-containing protein n=1 Tax=Hufsiella arboris TaxID=2695275 RepID=A0A7K1YCT3_9SPHI|nr:DUF4251 domain-containing protein [Hufsiella arboris]MXV51858.1 DUF4251 domain-containing protein [Hufsiella arboris]